MERSVGVRVPVPAPKWMTLPNLNKFVGLIRLGRAVLCAKSLQHKLFWGKVFESKMWHKNGNSSNSGCKQSDFLSLNLCVWRPSAPYGNPSAFCKVKQNPRSLWKMNPVSGLRNSYAILNVAIMSCVLFFGKLCGRSLYGKIAPRSRRYKDIDSLYLKQATSLARIWLLVCWKLLTEDVFLLFRLS